MVNRLRLNDKIVREQIPEEDRDFQVFDTEIRGLSIRVMRSGERSFVLDYRFAGRQRRMVIGRWPEWSVTAARERARELRRVIDEGSDPLGERGALREAPRFKDMIERYLAEHASTLAPLSASDQKSFLTKLVAPHWANKLVTEITPQDVVKLLNIIAQGRARPSKAKPNNRARKLQGKKPTPIRANRVGETLRKMFNLAVQWGWRADNPASGFKKRIETARERFLSHEEIARLIARDTAKDASLRRFRLDRIAHVEITNEWFEKDKDFNLEAYAAQSFGSFHADAEVSRVVWRFSSAAAAIAREFEFHPKQEIVEQDDGGLLVIFEASGLVEMAWHLYKWGDAVDVIEPAVLREMVASVQNNRITVLP